MRYPLTPEILDAIDRFYFNHYCRSFGSGAFARANSSMYVHLAQNLADFVIKAIQKPYVEHARPVDALRPTHAV
jgi:hypothetical protein